MSSHLMEATFSLRCSRQQGKPDECTKRSVGFGLLPNGAEFVVIENAISGALLWIGSSHAAHNRADVMVVAGGVPIGDRAHDAQNEIAATGPAVSLT